MTERSARSLVEASLLAALASVMFLGARYLPLLGIALSLVCPVPLVVLGLRSSLRGALTGLLVSSLLVFALSGLTGAVAFALGFGLMGVVMGAVARRMGLYELMLVSIGVSLLGKLAMVLFYSYVSGFNPFMPSPSELEKAFGSVLSFYSRLGLGEEALRAMEAQMKHIAQVLPILFPSILIMASAMDAYLSYAISRAVAVRVLGAAELRPLPGLSELRFPKSVGYLFVASLGSLLLPSEALSPLIAGALVNLRTLSSLLLILQGASVAFWFVRARGLPRFFYVLVAFLVLFLPLGSYLSVVLGFADVFFDFRGLEERRGDLA